MTTNPDFSIAHGSPWTVGGCTLTSRFFLGTSHYPSPQVLGDAVRASGTEVLTVGLRRLQPDEHVLDQIVDIGRDQENTFQALQEMRDIIERYPDSEYAASAQMKFELALDHLAGKEMEIGRYYLSRGHYTAAINRFRVVVEEYQTTTQTPEALHRLVESYLSLGLTQEAQTAAAILGYNFRGTTWYAQSYALLTGRGLTPQNTGDSWLNQTYRQVVKGEWR